MMEIISKKLTKENFKHYGDVISIETHINMETINDGFTKRYDISNYISNEKNNEGPSISIFKGIQRPLPLVINMLECHPLASQSFMPLNGNDWIVIVCKGNEKKPEINDIKCFVANNKQGVNYYPGTWHHPLITLDKTQDFLVVDRNNSKFKVNNNLSKYWFDNTNVKI